MDYPALSKVARDAIVQHLGSGTDPQVEVEPFLDSQGEEGLKVLVIFEQVPTLRPSRVTIAIRDAFLARGENRFPILEFATRQELAEDMPDES